LCAALIAFELFGNTAAIIAAVLAAIYPYYVGHEAPGNQLVHFLDGARSAAAARAPAVCVTCPLWLALAGGSHAVPWRRRLRVAVVCAGLTMLNVAPWLIRAYQLTGSATPSTQSGFFLWLGNNP
jgi:hypothetical protein